MAKKVTATIRLLIKGGTATPALGSKLGQYGLSIMDFCKRFNDATANRKGERVPVIISLYADKSFDIVVKTAPASDFIKKKANIAKGSGKVGSEIVGQITRADVEEIAKAKMPDLNAVDLEGAKNIVAGSARSMGIKIVD